ncbi:hypothetical protein DOO78_12995 [Roseicella frigidaeris]|uniref:Uncharacterized protein n=2 Tax=Roseicella frigidaeris TaxID=2230885 RepID=A0A327M8F4_9PROT|nr:hypothetical protein DOO78_12995 [Roseicella frigidaeris]
MGIALAALPGVSALAQRDPQAVPERIGPVWDHREHQPNPAEIEARARARGLAEQPRDREARDVEAQDVDRIFRDLTGSDPAAQPQSTRMRDSDRR